MNLKWLNYSSSIVVFIILLMAFGQSSSTAAPPHNRFGAPDLTERSLTKPTGWWWLTGVSAETLKDRIKKGYRIIDLEIEATSPHKFSATFVKNSGKHKKVWWWYYGKTSQQIKALVSEKKARIIDLEIYRINGQKRYAVVMVSNAGSKRKSWWYYSDQTIQSLLDKAKRNGARLVDLDTYTLDKKRRFSGVMIKNTGLDKKAWWYYHNVSADFIRNKLTQHGARLTDIEKHGANTFTVLMEKREGKGWWWWHGGTKDKILALKNTTGGRIFDIEKYRDRHGKTKFAALLLDNGGPSDIPVNGTGDAHLTPMVEALRDYMHYRCVGAATLGVSVKGTPVGVWGLGRMSGRAANDWDTACGDDMSLPVGEPVKADTPMRIGSVTKPVTFAMTRWAIKKVANDLKGLTMTDAQVEGLKLFDPEHYPPLIPGTSTPYPAPLIPRNLHAIYSGKAPVPVHVTDDGCGDLESDFADAQWQDVTLGHFFSHRSGLSRSAPSYVTAVSHLHKVRGLDSRADFAKQENLLRREYGNSVINSAKSQLGLPTEGGYFIRKPNLAEYLQVVAGRCLRHGLGHYQYSNTSPAFPVLILQQLMASHRYGATIAQPETHTNSALDVFFSSEVGIATDGTDGIFVTQWVQNVPGHNNPEPEKRHWNGTTYYGSSWDPKRPHCIWREADKRCDFSDWDKASPGKINWDWKKAKVSFPYKSTGTHPGTGSLAVEAKDFLKFMAKYWVNGTGNNPTIGEERALSHSPWTTYQSHNGALTGTLAWAMQLGGRNNPTSWKIPPRDASGRIVDDFANLTSYEGSLPDGVDIFVAINQRNGDKKCIEDDSYSCNDAYGLLDNFILYGASRVDWNLVTPPVIGRH